MQDRLRLRTAEDNTRSRYGEGRVLILGSPRSGTSWLAKLFDSHPDVLYRHEPDEVHHPVRLPKSIPPAEEDAHLDTARAYLDVLTTARTLRTAGPLPVLAKNYRSSLARCVRTGLILGVRGLEMAARDSRRLSRITIPDLVSRKHSREARIVIKSVNLLLYIRLFARAWPQGRFVFIVRHPCGQVASIMRGLELGKFAPLPASEPDKPAPVPHVETARSDEAERLGLRIDDLSALSSVEQAAWRWAFFNQKALQSIAGLNNVKLLVYEELAADPAGVARELFAFAGLAWDAQVERFIRDSTQRHETRYYSVKRNPLQAANRWQTALSVEDQQRIAAIASRVPIGRAFSLPAPDRAA
jgi:hypothetical protein